MSDFQTGHEAYEGTSSTRRPGALSLDYLKAWSLGPDDLSDTSQGLLHRVWRVRVDNLLGKVYLRRSKEPIGSVQDGWDPEFELFDFAVTEIDEIDLAFDQNGAPIVCAQRAGNQIWLYWFSPLAGTFVFEEIGEGRTPRLLLDDPLSSSDSDLLLFYVNDTANAPQWRKQAELYDTAHDIPLDRWVDVETGDPFILTDTTEIFIEEVAKSIDNRLHVFASRTDINGAYKLLTIETVPYPVRQMESLLPIQRLQQLDAIEYVLPADWQREDFFPIQRIAELNVVELIIIVSSDGPDSFITVENIFPAQRVSSSSVEDLVINYAATPETLFPAQKIQQLDAVLFVIVVPNLDAEKIYPAQKVQTITVSAA